MRSYTVVKAPADIKLDSTPWAGASADNIDTFPWYHKGDKQNTEFRIMYDAHAIYVKFICEDKHIDAQPRELNGAVCRDSCVEFFAIPDAGKNDVYFNFEANCCGQMHLGFGVGRSERKLVTPESAAKVTIVTPYQTETKAAEPGDNGWWLAARIPYDVLEQFIGIKIAPKSGDTWKANFYRCGGTIDDQYACWNNISWTNPDFHRPEFFGLLKFE